ncbi:hypothetical protein CIPAW_04G149700 [Carya illinoinensis]|uniref:Uncharacterized protein n=1 Tax=Carya illinoinensis TaxID=32201 RepID=A0A8T1QWH2_CARIL|nr:hypothetical protein CIPAW_04G149700 [Carya illinoinensis]
MRTVHLVAECCYHVNGLVPLRTTLFIHYRERNRISVSDHYKKKKYIANFIFNPPHFPLTIRCHIAVSNFLGALNSSNISSSSFSHKNIKNGKEKGHKSVAFPSQKFNFIMHMRTLNR